MTKTKSTLVYTQPVSLVETFLAPSADKQTRTYDTECSDHHMTCI